MFQREWKIRELGGALLHQRHFSPLSLPFHTQLGKLATLSASFTARHLITYYMQRRRAPLPVIRIYFIRFSSNPPYFTFSYHSGLKVHISAVISVYPSNSALFSFGPLLSGSWGCLRKTSYNLGDSQEASFLPALFGNNGLCIFITGLLDVCL